MRCAAERVADDPLYLVWNSEGRIVPDVADGKASFNSQSCERMVANTLRPVAV